MIILQLPGQTPACAHQVDLNPTGRTFHDLADFDKRHIFNIEQPQCCKLELIQAQPGRLPQLALLLHLHTNLFRACLPAGNRFEQIRRFRVVPALFAKLTYGDGEYPGAKTVTGAVALQILINRDKGILQDVLCIGTTGGPRQQKTVKPILVIYNKLLKGFDRTL